MTWEALWGNNFSEGIASKKLPRQNECGIVGTKKARVAKRQKEVMQ